MLCDARDVGDDSFIRLTGVACWEEKYGTLWGLADLSGAPFPGLKNGGYSSYKSLGWM